MTSEATPHPVLSSAEAPATAESDHERIYEASLPSGTVRQGEILINLTQLRINPNSLQSNQDIVVDSVVHPYAIALTQDCDLVQDFKPRAAGQGESDKLIPNILFCEVVTAEQLRGRADIKSDIWRRIKNNNDDRYQFLEKVPAEDDLSGQGLPELGVDFKRYFTVSTAEVYFGLASEVEHRCRLVGPYLQHFTMRFFNFQGRVALPAEHRSD